MRAETHQRDTRAGVGVMLPAPFPQLAPRFLLPCSSVRSRRSSLSVWVVFHLRYAFSFLHYSTAMLYSSDRVATSHSRPFLSHHRPGLPVPYPASSQVCHTRPAMLS